MSITLRVYGHLTPEGREDVAGRMEEVLGPRVEETALRIVDESLRGGDFELEIAPSGAAWRNVSQILFATAIYLWSRVRPAPRRRGVPSTLASASSVGGHA